MLAAALPGLNFCGGFFCLLFASCGVIEGRMVSYLAAFAHCLVGRERLRPIVGSVARLSGGFPVPAMLFLGRLPAAVVVVVRGAIAIGCGST